jgi:hypothetical protein
VVTKMDLTKKMSEDEWQEFSTRVFLMNYQDLREAKRRIEIEMAIKGPRKR